MPKDKGLCSSCHRKLEQLCLNLEIDETLEEEPLDGLEQLEELRRILSAFMNPSVLEGLLTLKEFIEETPAERYHWFIRNGSVGAECKFALMALDVFKKNHLELAKEKLCAALEMLEEL